MRDALLSDLAQLPYKISTTVDERLALKNPACSTIVIKKDDDVWQIWEQQVCLADAVWLVAPETSGVLKKLTQLAVRHQKMIIGCGLGSIDVASSKLATYKTLNKAGIATLPTYTLQNWPQTKHLTWLAKPDDGAGCEETICFKAADELARWINANNKASSHVIQHYQKGIPASISCVMHSGEAYILSCNQQLIEMINHQLGYDELSYSGSNLNGMQRYWTSFETVANQIAQVLPDLAGYVGVDVIVDEDKVIVVEINPRLTTSYTGLAMAIGANPAELIINTLIQEDFSWPILQQNIVEINV